MTIFFFAFLTVEVSGGGFERSGLEARSKPSMSGAQTTTSVSKSESGSSGSDSGGSVDFVVAPFRFDRRGSV